MTASNAPAPDAGLGERFARALGGPPGWMANAPVTRAIVWANIAAYVVGLMLAKRASAITQMPEHVMLMMGANYAQATLAEARYETLLTSSFLHFSILHIGFNLYALRQIGPPIERNIGSARMAPMYIASGIVGSAVSAGVGWASGDQRVSAGASGAICGVIGAALVLGLRAEGTKSPLARAMTRWLLMLLAFPFIARFAHIPLTIDNEAHFGGAAVGGLFAAAWRRGPPYGTRLRRIILSACASVVALAFALVGWRDAHDPFATMQAAERYEVARDLLIRHSCGPAGEAIAATARVVPKAPEVLALEQEYEATCGTRL